MLEALGKYRATSRLAARMATLLPAVVVGCSLLDPLDDISGGSRPATSKPILAPSDSGVDGASVSVRDAAPPKDAAPPYQAGDAGYIDLSGSWSGTWRQDYVINGGTVKMQFVQDGGAFIATGAVTGGGCPSSGSQTGYFVSPNETESKFTSESGAFVIEWTSKISADAKEMTGRFVSVGDCWPGVSGSTVLNRP